MLTKDVRCGDSTCAHKDIYRMVGACSNCGSKDVLMLFTVGRWPLRRWEDLPWRPVSGRDRSQTDTKGWAA